MICMHFQLLDGNITTFSSQQHTPSLTTGLNMTLGLTKKSLNCPYRDSITVFPLSVSE